MDITKLATMKNDELEKMIATEDKKIATAEANKKLIKRLILANSLSKKEELKKQEMTKLETPKTENKNDQPVQSTNVNQLNN